MWKCFRLLRIVSWEFIISKNTQEVISLNKGEIIAHHQFCAHINCNSFVWFCLWRGNWFYERQVNVFFCSRIAQSRVSLTGEWEIENPERLQKALSSERKSCCCTKYLQGYLNHESADIQNSTLAHAIMLFRVIFNYNWRLEKWVNLYSHESPKALQSHFMIPCKCTRSACLGISAYIRVCVVIIIHSASLWDWCHVNPLSPSPSIHTPALSIVLYAV